MKILYISPAYWPAVQFGGPINSVKLLAEEMVKIGNEVFVFTSAYGLEKNRNILEELNGVKIFYFKYFFFKKWIISFALIKELIKKRNDFDIFHINLVWDPISWMSGFVLTLFNKRIIISPRGTIEEELIKSKSYFLKTLVYHLLIKFIFRKTKGFHFTSLKEKEEFEKYTKIKKQSLVLYNHFDYSEFQKRISQEILDDVNLKDKKYILYLGRINWKKRIDLLIETFSEFVEKFSDFYLAIIGPADKDYYPKILSLIENLKLKNKIILVNRAITGDLKIAVLQNAFCFVLPSISENFGYSAVEALSAGVLLIISEGVGLKDDLVRYNAVLVFKEGSREDMKKSLFDNLIKIQNDKTKEQLIKNGLNFIEKEFDNTKITLTMFDFYNILCSF